MTLLDVVTQVGFVVAGLLAGTSFAVVGPARLRRAHRTVRSNLRAAWRPLGVLAGVLVANSVVREVGIELSWIIGLNLTGHIHGVEGALVAQLQSLASPSLTAYFGFVYVFGYTFLLTFPVVAYLLADDPRAIRVTLLAYVVNYGVGLLCYVLFVAYGPRNFMPELVEPLLYQQWPQSQLLVSEVNTNTNVFPSLHASLSVTVGILAYRFRDVYPRWLPVAAVLAASVAVSTMYLGIHWATDVAAGVGLAALSVAVASRVDAESGDGGWWRFAPASGWRRRARGGWRRGDS
jgi:membrane-associated phospholipid phosphatase